MARRFLNVRSDASFSAFVDADTLGLALRAVPDLKPGKHWPFVLERPGGAIQLLPVRCDSRGNYSVGKGQVFALVNLLELSCPDDDAWYPLCEEVAGPLAAALGWSWCWDDQEDAHPSQTA